MGTDILGDALIEVKHRVGQIEEWMEMTWSGWSSGSTPGFRDDRLLAPDLESGATNARLIG